MLDRLSDDTLFNRTIVGLIWYGLLISIFLCDYFWTVFWLAAVMLVSHYEFCILHRLSIHQAMREMLLLGIACNLIWCLLFWHFLFQKWPEPFFQCLPVLLSYNLFCVALSISAMIWNKQWLNRIALSYLLVLIPLESIVVGYYVPQFWQMIGITLVPATFIYALFFFTMFMFFRFCGNRIKVMFPDDADRSLNSRELYTEFWIWCLLCIVIALFAYGFAQLMLYAKYLLFLTMVIVTLNDTFGYFAGKIHGGRKICTTISPYKTYSGSIAGVIVSVSMIIMARILGADMDYIPLLTNFSSFILSNIYVIFYVLIVSVLGQFGDWFFSYLKRRVNIKNTGKILLSHGGLLDRLDSMLLPVIVNWAMFLLF